MSGRGEPRRPNSCAAGAVDASALRTQLDDARRRLRAIVNNPTAPLGAKAEAQQEFLAQLRTMEFKPESAR